MMVVVCNFIFVFYEGFCVGVFVDGIYQEVLNSNVVIYQGIDYLLNFKFIKVEKKEWDGCDYSIEFNFLLLGVIVFCVEVVKKKKVKKKQFFFFIVGML